MHPLILLLFWCPQTENQKKKIQKKRDIAEMKKRGAKFLFDAFDDAFALPRAQS
jgi:hypothetical protein